MRRLILFVGIISSNCYAQNLPLAEAALERTYHTVRYDPSYISIPYPNGDVPADTGVCTDVVIRSFRKLGIDLQKEVHEDISSNFQAYPSKRIWGLLRPDKNIDHRRVPNLQTFFHRKGMSIPITDKSSDYLPGDIITWMLPGNLPHIGIVSPKPSKNTDRFLIAHNIGAGPVLEDVLFSYTITGHYRLNLE
ncbi:DUF1287 domain-containing protein [Microbulbifer sp. THAF38]|uniref:DUF1287 domain-containing protein n=1 Tax=Microbulbifer sp. THAF38 TaxID=2587856 RepID=UPI0012A98717|nr:DUF1287 domain-containing protein [Microbulbifer sp. THAF38]QFT53281.1 hypothetical protein FIU95_01630 [Microbulbifer sp. THAF38]